MLRNFYNGNVYEAEKAQETFVTFEDENEREMEFWEWDMVMVFNNPDCQKKQKMVKRNKALRQIMAMFKAMERGNEIQKKIFRHAEEEVVAEIIDQWVVDGKIPLYHGG